MGVFPLGQSCYAICKQTQQLDTKEADLLTYIIPLLILDLLICVLSGASYFTATMEC